VPEPLPRAAHVFHFFLDREGFRAGVFPNGWPAVLAVGVALGAPAYVNAVLHGLTVLLGAGLARGVAGAAGAFVAAPLLAVSPQALLQGASRMSHTLVALLALVLLRFAVLPVAAGWRRGALVGGALAGIALTRPLDAAVIAVVLLPAIYRRLPDRREAAAVLALGALALGLTAAQNVRLTGDALRFPQTAYFDEMPPPLARDGWRYAPGCNRLGFGADRGCMNTGGFGHEPAKALVHTRHNLGLAGRLWMGTPWALLLAPVGLAFVATRRLAAVALLLAAGLVGAYALYWFHGACLGARFYHPALPPVVLAIALAAVEALRAARLRPAFALLLLLPMAWRIPDLLPELGRYWGVDDRFHELQRTWTQGEALVLVGYREERALSISPETSGLGVPVTADLLRGSWFGATDGPIRFAEYQPALVDATRRAYGDPPTFLYVMGDDRSADRIRPLATGDRAPEQLDDLPLPARVPAFPPAPPR
jgi:hypothetical protein